QKVRELAQKVQQVPQDKPGQLILLLSKVQELSKACTDYIAGHGKEDDAQAKMAKGLKSVLDGIAASLLPSKPSSLVAVSEGLDLKGTEDYANMVTTAHQGDPEALKAIVLESIDAEMSRTTEGGTAFRGNSFASKMQAKYAMALNGEVLTGLMGGALDRC